MSKSPNDFNLSHLGFHHKFLTDCLLVGVRASVIGVLSSNSNHTFYGRMKGHVKDDIIDTWNSGDAFC